MTKFKYLLALPLALSLASCAEMMGGKSKTAVDEPSGELPYVFSDFSDIPVPEKVSMDMNNTSIFGRDEDWLGKIAFSSPYDISGMFDFYMSEMPRFGWAEITSLRAKNSVLVYIRGRRVALIQISAGTLDGSSVTFSMASTPQSLRKAAAAGNSAAASVIDAGSTPSAAPSNKKQMEVKPRQQSLNDKSAAGSLGLGDASNVNYPSDSRGVGKPAV